MNTPQRYILGATIAGSGMLPNPVTFSFGWVAYTVPALLSVVGENRLICCPPEIPLMVFNLKSSYCRSNKSWLLSRLVKTYEHWMPSEVRHRLYGKQSKGSRSQNTDEENNDFPPLKSNLHTALCVAIYRDLEPGVATRDWVWRSGYVVSLIQLGVSAIPLGLNRDYSVFLATAFGTLLSYSLASLPQWQKEKWNARKSEKTVALTQGNGTHNVIIIEGGKGKLDLEDLAGGMAPSMWSTRVFTLVLSLLWLVLLITCTGINDNTWYLLAVGGIGMLHNIFIAASPRKPEAMGLPIELKTSDSGYEIFAERKVMWSLMELELKYTGYGKVLRDEFFPGALCDDEKEWWNSNDKTQRRQKLSEIKKKQEAKWREEAERLRLEQEGRKQP